MFAGIINKQVILRGYVWEYIVWLHNRAEKLTFFSTSVRILFYNLFLQIQYD